MIREAQALDSKQRFVPNALPSASGTAPECPKCGTQMVKRTNRRSHESFWGCPKYPSCRGTRPA
jgi:restriction system protein